MWQRMGDFVSEGIGFVTVAGLLVLALVAVYLKRKSSVLFRRIASIGPSMLAVLGITQVESTGCFTTCYEPMDDFSPTPTQDVTVTPGAESTPTATPIVTCYEPMAPSTLQGTSPASRSGASGADATVFAARFALQLQRLEARVAMVEKMISQEVLPADVIETTLDGIWQECDRLASERSTQRLEGVAASTGGREEDERLSSILQTIETLRHGSAG